ncbi:hypothetical protein PC116_g14755 [Phytophthora cactorum]|uniref:Uncharacterized protein n=1 Tax=Phytophthora cactorum TaxID=29920 RepID=A0A8T1KKT8_9STRA|nr:hypothetical protein PC112_g15018 [Phytophthora cactorum]KAG2850959.1 hypothetical protein PC113_g16325 [Phytophthora cactorum]KAG4237199.1 hypothetical protein PC116_g14755 [Phytophthora cactorum]
MKAGLSISSLVQASRPASKRPAKLSSALLRTSCGGNVAVVSRSCVPEGIGAAHFLHSTAMGSSNLK